MLVNGKHVIHGYCCCSVTQLCLTLCDPMECSTEGFLSITVSRDLLWIMFIESMMPPNHFILCHPLLLLPSIFPNDRVFSSELALHIRWLKNWSFSFSISPSSEYSGLISSRMNWLDLLCCTPTQTLLTFSSVQFSSVTQLCLTLCDPMNRSTPGLPVHHQLLESTQIHVHWVADAIEPSHPLSSPSPPAPNPSQHQGLFQWVNSSHEVAKVVAFQLQHQSFQWTPRADLL